MSSQGKNLAECMKMATDAVSNVVEAYGKARKMLPEPSDAATAKRKVEETLDALGETVTSGMVLQLVPAPSVDLTPVKISISVPRTMLDSIDAKARTSGMTRSGFLVAAAQAYV